MLSLYVRLYAQARNLQLETTLKPWIQKNFIVSAERLKMMLVKMDLRGDTPVEAVECPIRCKKLYIPRKAHGLR
jgi:hypothetical protein